MKLDEDDAFIFLTQDRFYEFDIIISQKIKERGKLSFLLEPTRCSYESRDW